MSDIKYGRETRILYIRITQVIYHEVMNHNNKIISIMTNIRIVFVGLGINKLYCSDLFNAKF